MLSFFGKKRISEDAFANYFVTCSIEAAENSFQELAEIINFDPVFIKNPNVKAEDFQPFLLIVICANLSSLPKEFESNTLKNIEKLVIEKFARIFEVEPKELRGILRNITIEMERLNHPSKNIYSAMAKGLIQQYDLNKFQEYYFKNLNTPNPLFLKRIQEVMKQYIFDWSPFLEKFKISA